MFKSIRNALLAGLIAAVGMIGVSYAATGSLNPANIVSHDSGPGGGGVTRQTGSSEETATGSSDVTPTASHGPERSTEGCPAGFTGNHGQFVSHAPKGSRSDAAHSDCGKPVKATTEDEQNETPEPSETPEAQHNNEDQGNVNHHDDGQAGQGGRGHADGGNNQSENQGRGGK